MRSGTILRNHVTGSRSMDLAALMCHGINDPASVAMVDVAEDCNTVARDQMPGSPSVILEQAPEQASHRVHSGLYIPGKGSDMVSDPDKG